MTPPAGPVADAAGPAATVETPEQAAARERADAEAKAAAEREAQLQRLLTHMQTNADFPSLKDSIRGIQKVARSESAHLRALTDEVLGDPALSNKLLRMINAAFYSSVGGGQITSLARAVALMGFQTVGMLATSLTLFEKLPKGPDGERVKQEFSRGLMAAMLANQFCPLRRLEENAYLVGMFQNLGTMLAWMHFPPQALQVELLMHERGLEGHAALQQAAREVLGMGYDDLGIEVARLWGWPPSLQAQLRRLEPADPEAPVGADDYLRVVGTAANQLALELEQVEDGEEAREALLASFRERYAIPLGLSEEDLPAMVERAENQWADLSLVLGIAKAAPGLSQGAVRRKPVSISLGHALDDLTRLAASQAPMAELLQVVMARLFETLELQRVIICLRDASNGGELVGRLGLGERAVQLAPVFRVPMRPPSDLFGLLAARGADTLISDTDDPVIATRLPIWYRRRIDAPTFLMLPMTAGTQALGLIYGDKAQRQSLAVGEAELKLLKALRDQLLGAMRQRGLGG
ncbi:HDOD domain-containing protein [Piscinibacter sakaiensis]|uniref:HDOD domain-containing protein n=1 Tax=Piscinibacter sakaiensis TaxID=1547922 RepID=UPI0037285BF7